MRGRADATAIHIPWRVSRGTQRNTWLPPDASDQIEAEMNRIGSRLREDKMRLASLLLLCGLLAGCQARRPHQYEIQRTKDGNGNDAFVRIDKTTGDECAVGWGFAVIRDGRADNYILPTCHQQTQANAQCPEGYRAYGVTTDMPHGIACESDRP